MRRTLFRLTTVILLLPSVHADDHPLLQKHCGSCHSGGESEGDFSLSLLEDKANSNNRDHWLASFEYVKSGEMPPNDEASITDEEREAVAEYLRNSLLQDSRSHGESFAVAPRRLNNREFANSVTATLLIEDAGTHQPLGSLLGDSLHEGFDTNGDVLGISEYHIEQYIDACRKIVDAVILDGERPESKNYDVTSDRLQVTSLAQRSTRNRRALVRDDSLEFTDPRIRMYFDNFQAAPASGWYRIRINATGIDRGYYDADKTGVYDDDAIRLQVRFGDRQYSHALPDDETKQLEFTEWLAEGTRIELAYPTDGLNLLSNGNFKFQNRIAHDHIKATDPALYQHVLKNVVPKSRNRSDTPGHWSHWVKYWRGPRPRVYNATVEGPFYESWPSKRQIALIGSSPTVENAEAILKPIAERAWRRDVQAGELDSIVQLVQDRAPQLGNIGALKEGIVALLVSPSFLFVNSSEGTPSDQFASKVAYFLHSEPPTKQFRSEVAAGELKDFGSVRNFVSTQFNAGFVDEFLEEFPRAWLQLDRINFMAPDPDQYHHYHRKAVSEDMIAEATRFFRSAVEENVPIPEMLTADYSYVNADLAKVYGLDDVKQDSQLREYWFKDGRRGGLLGMGAFLTSTADSQGTSPIHRAVYVLENFLGTKPAPPPGDIEIPEPDVRSAQTIKEVLKAHTADKTCASCHRSIDPYGYAFENFDPSGAWRDFYVLDSDAEPSDDKGKAATKRRSKPVPVQTAIDSSSAFRSGNRYQGIVEFRQLMQSKANQERFVRCFIEKLLLYANGEAPHDFTELDRLLQQSSQNNYRIVDTIAAVMHSPLFRGN